MLVIRHIGRAVRDLAAYVVRTGRWWMPLLLILLAITSVVVTAAKVVVPTVVYTLF
ncbi:MAG: DUF5989 family protein [Acidimicrobiales bacterium]